MKLQSALIAVLLVWVILCSSGCSKDNGYVKAVITGYDNRMCMCCGGLMINFDNNPKPYSGTFYDLSNDPDSLGISNQTGFPIYMNVQCKGNTTGCPNIIRITSIER